VIRRVPNHAGTWPSGSLYSCAEDLSRFLQSVLDDGVLEGRRVLPAAVVRGLRSAWVEVVEPSGHRYGYGFMHLRVEGEDLIFHTGSRLGYGSYIALAPGRRFAIAVLTNRSGRMLRSWAGTAMTRLAGLSAEVEPVPAKITLREAAFRPLLGTYENPPGLRYELFNSKLVPWTREGGQLFSRRGLMRMPVYRIGANRFTDGQVTFTTEVDESGRPRFLHGEWRTLVRRAEGRAFGAAR
jgi:CubicO group peptidase (beta-lactamase class C family)